MQQLGTQLLVPTAQQVAQQAVARVAAVTSEVDTVLSRLAYSCRKGDPELLDELRGELLFMARVIEEPVSGPGCGG